MPTSLESLAAWIDPGRTCLVLGAGASIASGAPSSSILRDELVRQLDPEMGTSHSLEDTAEILDINVGRRRVVDVVRGILAPLAPTGGLLALGAYMWREIYTTNYDKLVEASFRRASKEIMPIRSSYDLPRLDASAGGTPIFKMHGCVSQDRAFGDPSSLVLTGTDYRESSAWREQCLRRLGVSLEQYKAVVIGQSLSDRDMRDLLEDLAALQATIGRPGRIRLLMYSSDAGLAAILERKQIEVTFGGIDELFGALAALPEETSIVSFAAEESGTFSLPQRLLASTIDASHAQTLRPDPRRMFSGTAASYSEVATGQVFRRDAETDIKQRLSRANIVAVTGVAGVGKTTLARLALTSWLADGGLAWEHRPEMTLDARGWLTVDQSLRELELKGLLLLDDVTGYQRQANDLVDGLGARSSEPRGLSVIATAEAPLWRRRVKSRRFFEAGEPIELRELSRRELAHLAALVDTAGEIHRLVDPKIRGWSQARRIDFLAQRCSADMFVSLHHLFSFASLDEIVLTEYNSLEERDREVYRHLAVLEAGGVRPHRQLVIRLLGLSLDEVISISNDLEGVLQEETYSQAGGIYIWRTRHPVIARIIAGYKFADPAEHESLLRRVVTNLNASVDLERESTRELCNASFGIRRIPDPQVRIELYQVLVGLNPRDNVLRHRLVSEYLEVSDLRMADVALEQAVQDVGWDPPLHRFSVRLLRERAVHSVALDDVDRQALLRQAWDRATDGVRRYPNSYYSFLELDNVARDWLELTRNGDWLDFSIRELRRGYDELLEPELLNRAQSSDRVLTRADRQQASTPPLPNV